MGWRNFSKIFEPTRIVRYKDLRGMTIAIDAMTELYRAALGAKSVALLTDPSGNPTLHISVVMAVIIELQKQQVNQIWVFDHNQDPTADFHNPMKLGELAKRKRRKEIAIEQIQSLSDVKNTDPMFSDDEDTSASSTTTSVSASKIPVEEEEEIPLPVKPEVSLSAEEETRLITMNYRQKAVFMLKKRNEVNKQYEQMLADYEFEKTKKDRIQSLEKQTFSVSKEMIRDIKYILTCLNIKYIEAPSGFEGEHIASYLTQIGQADAVFSGDTDPMAYGATTLLRRNPKDKQIYEYTQVDLLRQVDEANAEITNPTINDLLVCAMASGTDACEKTPGIGPKTVLKKLHEIELTNAQKAAMKEFTKVPDLTLIHTVGEGKEPFVDCRQDELLEWLVVERGFSRSRIKTQLEKCREEEAPTPAPTPKLKSTVRTCTTVGKVKPIIRRATRDKK